MLSFFKLKYVRQPSLVLSVIFMRVQSAGTPFFLSNNIAGGVSLFDQVRTMDKDAVARLRIGKANMHELRLRITRNN